MSEQRCSKVAIGTVKDDETGEIFESAMMMTNAIMETIIKVQNMYSHSHSHSPMQLFIECLALDGVGEVFELGIHFPFLSPEDYGQFLESFTAGALWNVNGMFGIGNDDEGKTTITLISPEFHSLPPEDVLDVESTFRINGKGQSTKVDD